MELRLPSLLPHTTDGLWAPNALSEEQQLIQDEEDYRKELELVCTQYSNGKKNLVTIGKEVEAPDTEVDTESDTTSVLDDSGSHPFYSEDDEGGNEPFFDGDTSMGSDGPANEATLWT